MSPAGSGPGAPDSPERAGADVCIHIVDDDASFRGSLVFLLDAVGLSAREYGDAASFLGNLPDGPGCVILDLAMPGLTGLDLQRVLTGQGFDMPIVFLSAHGDLRSGVRAMRAGAEDFLSKPVDADELLDAVRRALVRDSQQRQTRALHDTLCARVARLSARELEVLRHVISGRLNKQIASDLGLALQTVKFHRAHVMAKLQAASVGDLSHIARVAGVRPV
jgi:FixJ family two-component response regulator